jgi:flagellar biosynthesis/type III secretory pathway M-ring protein FliF/YscJ
MVLVTNNWRLWAVGMLTSLIIFAVVYFAVIQPSTNTANQALKAGMQQTQQVINQAKKQINSSGASAAVANQASQQLNKASKLTSCVTAAGTDPSKLANCQSQYGG